MPALDRSTSQPGARSYWPFGWLSARLRRSPSIRRYGLSVGAFSVSLFTFYFFNINFSIKKIEKNIYIIFLRISKSKKYNMSISPLQSCFLTPFGVRIPSSMPPSYKDCSYEWPKLLMSYVTEAKEYTSLADASANLGRTGENEYILLQSEKEALPFQVALSPRCFVSNGMTKIPFATFGELVNGLRTSIAQRLEESMDVAVAPYQWMPVEREIPRSSAAIEVIKKFLKRFPIDISTFHVHYCGYYDYSTGKHLSAPHQVRVDCRDTYLRVTFDGSDVKNPRSVVLEDGERKFFRFTTEEELIAAIESATGMKPAPMGGAGEK